MPCRLGEAPGYWDGMEWRLHPTRRCAGSEVLQFIGVHENCTHPGRTFPAAGCQVRNYTLLDRLRNSSLLMLGDSTARELMVKACRYFRQQPYTFVRSGDRARNKDYHMCRLLANETEGGSRTGRSALELPIGSFSHYGVTGPPYWDYAYPLYRWLANNTFDQLRLNAPSFRDAATGGADPTLVVIPVRRKTLYRPHDRPAHYTPHTGPAQRLDGRRAMRRPPAPRAPRTYLQHVPRPHHPPAPCRPPPRHTPVTPHVHDLSAQTCNTDTVQYRRAERAHTLDPSLVLKRARTRFHPPRYRESTTLVSLVAGQPSTFNNA